MCVCVFRVKESLCLVQSSSVIVILTHVGKLTCPVNHTSSKWHPYIITLATIHGYSLICIWSYAQYQGINMTTSDSIYEISLIFSLVTLCDGSWLFSVNMSMTLSSVLPARTSGGCKYQIHHFYHHSNRGSYAHLMDSNKFNYMHVHTSSLVAVLQFARAISIIWLPIDSTI